MIAPLIQRRAGPIGIDLGSRSVKLVQLSADRHKLLEATRWDLPGELAEDVAERTAQWAQAIRQAMQGRKFRGTEAAICLGSRELFVQNIRVPKASGPASEGVIRREAHDRIPFGVDETELRWLEAADVKQGDTVRREVIVLACRRPLLTSLLDVLDQAGLRPVAVDVEPLALLRCYTSQFRRDEDQLERRLYVHIGNTTTAAIISQGSDVLFIKYLAIGGRHLDEAVASRLQMAPDEAWGLRRHNGDRRADQQDPEVNRTIAESVRPVVDRLAGEISLCMRYHSVTFRGQPLARMVLGGGEANDALAHYLNEKLDLRCELTDPLRSYERVSAPGRRSQWDVALGLALRAVK